MPQIRKGLAQIQKASRRFFRRFADYKDFLKEKKSAQSAACILSAQSALNLRPAFYLRNP
jgi:hypothetical protein